MSQATSPHSNNSWLSPSPSGGVGSPALHSHAKAPPAWEALEGGKATLARLFGSWSLPALGQAKLLEVLESEPVSHVRATRRSVAVHVPSAKMGRVIQAASRTVEYAFVHYCEYHPDVLLYLDQPLTVEIRIVDNPPPVPAGQLHVRLPRGSPGWCPHLRVQAARVVAGAEPQAKSPIRLQPLWGRVEPSGGDGGFSAIRVFTPRVPLWRCQFTLASERAVSCRLPGGGFARGC